MMINTETLAFVISAVGMLAFATSVIVEVFKGISLLKKIPTDIVVLVVSTMLTITACVAYCNKMGIPVTVYALMTAFIGSFFVAFVAMYGWDKFNELLTRFKK